jgi:hypothetical protein
VKKYRMSALVLILVAVSSSFVQAGKAEGIVKPSTTETQAATSVREAMNKERLSALLSAVGVSVEDTVLPAEVQSFQELRIRWDVADPSSQGPAFTQQEPPNRVLTTIERRKRNQALSRQRSLELSTNQILVVAINGQRQLRWWSLIPDPRIARAESPDAGGKLSGQVLYQSKAEFIVSFPDDETITELRLYHPHWTGSEFTLQPLGAVPSDNKLR